MGNILTTANVKMATKDITIPEVKLFNCTGHNSPSKIMGITLKPMEWNRIKALELIIKSMVDVMEYIGT